MPQAERIVLPNTNKLSRLFQAINHGRVAEAEEIVQQFRPRADILERENPNPHAKALDAYLLGYIRAVKNHAKEKEYERLVAVGPWC